MSINTAHYTILRPGDRVLVQLSHFPADVDEAKAIKEKLIEAFPGVFFVLVDGAVQAVMPQNEPPARKPTTFVMAPNRPAAIAWCKRNRVQPFSSHTVIATSEVNARGYDLHDGDRVVLLDPPKDVFEAWRVMEQIAESRRVQFTVEADTP